MPRLLLLPLLLLPACTPAGRAVKVQPSPYYPLEVGTEWVFRGPDHQRILRAVKYETINDIPCTLVETLRDDHVVAREHIFATPDGIYGLTSEGRTLSQPLPILKLPPRPGLTWTVDFKKAGGTYRGVYLVGAETVEVPFGRFQAVTLQGELTRGGIRQVSFLYWFAENVGLVKQVIRLPKETLTYELEKFRRGQ